MIIKNYTFWGATFVGLLLDRLTKLWVVTHFDLILPPNPPDSWPIWPGVFHLTYIINKGAAFGFFQGEFWLPWVSLLVSVGLVFVGLKMKGMSRWEQLAFGLILSGAAGNGLDRFLEGHVVDFLHFPWILFPIFDLEDKAFRLISFPIFNVADVLINIGLICLLIWTWRQPQQKKDA